MSTDPADPSVVVPAMLAAAGLSPSADEMAAFIKDYAFTKMSVAALYAVPEARYEVPALVFDPVPTFADWAS